MAVNISIKPQTEALDVELDLTQLTLDDAISLMKLQAAGDEESINELLPLISRVASVDVRQLPILDAQAIIQAVVDAIQFNGDTEKN